MFVEEEYRSKGIGKSLREEFYNWAEDSGASIIRSRVSAKNQRKIDFDKKEGFEEYEIILEKKVT